MPTIHGETDRGLRVLPWLSAGQALGLLATGGAVWLAWRTGWPLPVRTAAASVAAAAGLAYTLARWPAGADGERIATWLPRIARHAFGRRTWAGCSVPGWEGVVAVERDLVRLRGGWSLVVEIEGGDFTLRGAQACAAAQAAVRELLHAAPSPLQVVNVARRLRMGDMPRHMDPERAPAGLEDVAWAYRAQWERLVAERRAVRRTCLLVVTDVERGDRLNAAEAALLRCAGRLGLAARRLSDTALVSLLHELEGAADARCGHDAHAAWRVGLRHV